MKKYVFSLVLVLQLHFAIAVPNLQQLNFIGISVPLYMAAGNTTRLPVVYLAELVNLQPNTVYRYFSQAAIAADFGGTSTGAGNTLVIDYTTPTITYTYASTVSISTLGGYGRFITNANGSFKGFFAFVNTSNTRFTPGNTIYPTIALAIETGSPTSPELRLALNQGISVLAFGSGSTLNEGSFLKGQSFAAPGNIAALWRTVDGSSLLARPLSMSFIENLPINQGAGLPVWGAGFINGYDNSPGSYNTIIPNLNPNGVRLIQAIDVRTGNVLACNSNSQGSWPGGANTINPGTGTTPLQILNTDAPLTGGTCLAILPVVFEGVAIVETEQECGIKWTNLTESDILYYVIEQSDNAVNYYEITKVQPLRNDGGKADYLFSHKKYPESKYYRIRAISINDDEVISPVIKSRPLSSNKILVYPNPIVENKIKVIIKILKPGRYRVTLYNTQGRLCFCKTIICNSSHNDITIVIPYHLTPGIYFMQMEGLHYDFQTRLVLK